MAHKEKEVKGRGLIHENKSAMSFLPQDVIIEAYPREGGMMPHSMEDGLPGIDKQMAYDNRKIKENMKPRKA